MGQAGKSTPNPPNPRGLDASRLFSWIDRGDETKRERGVAAASSFPSLGAAASSPSPSAAASSQSPGASSSSLSLGAAASSSSPSLAFSPV